MIMDYYSYYGIILALLRHYYGLSWHYYGIIMDYHCIIMALSWHYYGLSLHYHCIIMALLWHYHCIVMALLWIIMASIWHYYGIIMALLWHYYSIIMALIWHYYGITMALLWHYYKIGFSVESADLGSMDYCQAMILSLHNALSQTELGSNQERFDAADLCSLISTSSCENDQPLSHWIGLLGKILTGNPWVSTIKLVGLSG